MKWNVALLIISVVLLVLFGGSGVTQHLATAEAIAEELAPEIHADVDDVRTHLVRILARGNVRRTIVLSLPLLVLVMLNGVRLYADMKKSNRA